MDKLPPPDELRQYWLDDQPPKEDAAMMATQILIDARKFRRRTHGLDIGVIVAYTLFIPILILMALGALDESPLISAGLAVWIITCLAGLVAYWRFFRSLGEEPPPNAPSREYVQHSLDYVGRRERFLVASAMPISALSAVAGIIFAVAIEKGQQTDWALAWVIVVFAMQPVSWWWTLAYQRQSARRRAKLLQILTDLEG